jgi:hypothetical protein
MKIRNELVRYETYIPLPSGNRRRRVWVAEDGGRCGYRDGSDYAPDGAVVYAYSGPWSVVGTSREVDNGETVTTVVTPALMTPDELVCYFLGLGWVLTAPGTPAPGAPPR